jgi:succinate dehydrogenase / fumarate reductase cytochrome b subunit
MALDRNVGLKGYRYRGGLPMLSWRLHRWTGIGIVVFVSLHMIASLFGSQGSDWGIAINTVYESVYFQIVVVGLVYYHALHGLRVILLDFWPRFLEYQREITWAQWLIFIPLYLMSVMIMLMAHFSAAA